MTTHHLSDFHTPLPVIVAELIEINQTDSGEYMAMFRIPMPKGGGINLIKLAVGDILPIGDNHCSNWKAVEIGEVYVTFANSGVFMLYDKLSTKPRPKQKG